MNTTKFTVTIGIVSGYQGQECLQVADSIPKDAIGKAWQKAAAKVMEDTGIYVSATISQSKALYATDWGCPIGGEPTFTISGSRNPEFCKDDESWQEATLTVIRLVKDAFQQSTVAVEFQKASLLYIKD